MLKRAIPTTRRKYRVNSTNEVTAADESASTVTRTREYHSMDESDTDAVENGFELVGVVQFTPWFISLVTSVQMILMFILLLRMGLDNISFKPTVSSRDVQVRFESF